MPSKRVRIAKSLKRRSPPLTKGELKVSTSQDMNTLNDVTNSVNLMHLADKDEQKAEDNGTDLPRGVKEPSESEVDEKMVVSLPPGTRKPYEIWVSRCPNDENDAKEYYVSIMEGVMDSRDLSLAVLKANEYRTASFFVDLTTEEYEKLLEKSEVDCRFLGIFAAYVPVYFKWC